MSKKIGVVGTGLMGAEIALVFAQAGHNVLLNVRDQVSLDRATARLRVLMEKGVGRGFYKLEEIEPTLARSGFVRSTQAQLHRDPLFFARLAHDACRGDPWFRYSGDDGRDGDPCDEEHWKDADTHQGCRRVRRRPDAACLHDRSSEAGREGVATPEDLDIACRLGLGHPIGPFALMDAVTSSRQQILQEAYGERFRPPALLKQRVRAGYGGGKGKPGWFSTGK